MSDCDFGGSDHRFGGSSHDSFHDGGGDNESVGGFGGGLDRASVSAASSRGFATVVGLRSGIALPTISPAAGAGTTLMKRSKNHRVGGSAGGDTSNINTAGDELALTLISASSRSFTAPRPLRPLIESQDHLKTREELWNEIKSNITEYIFASADAQQAKIKASSTTGSNAGKRKGVVGSGEKEVAVPFAMAKLVAYAKYGPAVEDPRGNSSAKSFGPLSSSFASSASSARTLEGTFGVSNSVPPALRLRGSQSLLMKHEEAALIREEVRAIIVDIYLLKTNKKINSRGKARNSGLGEGSVEGQTTVGGSSGSDAPRRLSMKALAAASTSPTEANNALPNKSEKRSASVVSISLNQQNTHGGKQLSSGTYNSLPSAQGVVQKGSGTHHTPQRLANTIVNPKTGSVVLPDDSNSTKSHLVYTHSLSVKDAVAAPNVKATAVPDSVFGIEMLDQQHPMVRHVLELSRLELKQLLDFCERSLPMCEKDGSKVTRSTLIDHLADAIFTERDKRVLALKRADAQLEDVRTDPLLTKRKAITVYNKTHPPAYSITSLDKPHHVQRMLHRRAFQVSSDKKDGNSTSVAQNVRIVRDEFRIEPGSVAEGWDGYCCVRNKRYGGGPVQGRPDVV